MGLEDFGRQKRLSDEELSELSGLVQEGEEAFAERRAEHARLSERKQQIQAQIDASPSHDRRAAENAGLSIELDNVEIALQDLETEMTEAQPYHTNNADELDAERRRKLN